MTKELNEKLTIVEVTLLNELLPDYIEVSYQSGYFYVLIAKEDYKYYTLSERILDIFQLLKWNCKEILEEFPFIIETFDSNELDGLLGMYEK